MQTRSFSGFQAPQDDGMMNEEGRSSSRLDDDLSIQSTRHSIGNILHEACVVLSSDDGYTKLPPQQQQTSFFGKQQPRQPSLRKQCGLLV